MTVTVRIPMIRHWCPQGGTAPGGAPRAPEYGTCPSAGPNRGTASSPGRCLSRAGSRRPFASSPATEGPAWGLRRHRGRARLQPAFVDDMAAGRHGPVETRVVGLPPGAACRPPRCGSDDRAGRHLPQSAITHRLPAVQADRHRWLAQPLAARVLSAWNMVRAKSPQNPTLSAPGTSGRQRHARDLPRNRGRSAPARSRWRHPDRVRPRWPDAVPSPG